MPLKPDFLAAFGRVLGGGIAPLSGRTPAIAAHGIRPRDFAPKTPIFDAKIIRPRAFAAKTPVFDMKMPSLAGGSAGTALAARDTKARPVTVVQNTYHLTSNGQSPQQLVEWLRRLNAEAAY